LHEGGCGIAAAAAKSSLEGFDARLAAAAAEDASKSFPDERTTCAAHRHAGRVPRVAFRAPVIRALLISS